MLSRKKEFVQFDLARCVQCGTCLAACPQDALNLTLRNDGLWVITPITEKCSQCFRCVAVCPAHSLPQKKIFQADLNTVLDLHLTHASDPAIRSRSSSGGAARILARTALETGLVNTVYAVTTSGQYPWAEGTPLTQPLEVSRLANSMYLPILVNKHLHKIQNSGPVLLVGTTCQLLAAERLLKNTCKQIYKIAIFCKQQKNLKSTCFMAKRLGLDPLDRDYAQVEYRGVNWPGRVQINGKQMKWETAASLPYGKRLWRVPGCRLCSNPFGIEADLTLADPWGLDQAGTPGNTLVAVWTLKGRALLEGCQHQLTIKEIDKAFLSRSVTWRDIQRKRLLVDYYAGVKVPLHVHLCGLTERFQTSMFELLLEHSVLPEFAYRVLGRIPDATNVFLKGFLKIKCSSQQQI